MTRRQFLCFAAGLGGAAMLSQTQRCVQAGGDRIFLPMVQAGTQATPGVYNAAAPAARQRLIFIHHSTGQSWLADDNGGLGLGLAAANYFVSDTNYGWGPQSIGDRTDIGNWYDWFLGPNRASYLSALYAEGGQHCSYTRPASGPAGENNIVMFKSCFPNSTMYGNPYDPPTTGSNSIYSQAAGNNSYSVGNIKALYRSLLDYFVTRPDKLFVIVLAPPLVQSATNASQAANARAVNTWLTTQLLSSYSAKNVAVFDFFDVLTSNGGSADANDAGLASGNHHRYRNNSIEYITSQGSNFSMYGAGGDSHPSAAGGKKATAEFIPLLNIATNRWKGG